MQKLILLTFSALAVLLSAPSFAAVFDSADILPRNAGAVGALGEILLSDPSSEGVEARARYGLADDWNVGGVIGSGSKAKGFRLGVNSVYLVIPDWEGQIGFSLLGDATYLRREINSSTSGGILFRVAPLAHKRLTGWNDLPATVYVALPISLEARSSTYTTGTQFVVGSLFDMSASSRYYLDGEVGIKLAKSDSYVLVGIGFRLGDLKFERRDSAEAGKHPVKDKDLDEPVYRDEDFKKKK